MIMLRTFATLALVASLGTVSAPALAQRAMESVVVLTSQDRALIDAKAVAAKDVLGRLLARQPAQAGLRLVSVQSCTGVPADTVQGLIKDLQKNGMMPVVDLNAPDPRLCGR